MPKYSHTITFSKTEPETGERKEKEFYTCVFMAKDLETAIVMGGQIEKLYLEQIGSLFEPYTYYSTATMAYLPEQKK